jgi:hypothetical protein
MDPSLYGKKIPRKEFRGLFLKFVIERKKLTDTGFFGFFWIWTVGFLQSVLDSWFFGRIWISGFFSDIGWIDNYYQSTSDTNIVQRLSPTKSKCTRSLTGIYDTPCVELTDF